VHPLRHSIASERDEDMSNQEEAMPNLLWLQGGARSGNTMSFLNAEEPSAVDLVTDFGINVSYSGKA
jgi:Ni,Fe-hydrogenase I small subunit